MKEQYVSISTNCTGGLNQNPDKTTIDQVTECLNVWAPDAVVVQRPGCQGIGACAVSDIPTTGMTSYYASTDVSGPTTVVKQDNAGGGDLTISSFEGFRTGTAGDYVYFGIASLSPGTGKKLIGAYTPVHNTNANNIQMKFEYWNGTAWTYIEVPQVVIGVTYAVAGTSFWRCESLYNARNPVYNAITTFIFFVPPEDWVSSALVNTATGVSTTAFWLRGLLISCGDNQLTNPTTLYEAVVAPVSVERFLEADLDSSRGFFTANLPRSKRYITVRRTRDFTTNKATAIGIASTPNFFGEGTIYYDPEPGNWTNDLPASIAVVPQEEYAYVAYGGTVYRLALALSVPDSVAYSVVCTVEDRDWAVGTGAPWDKNAVAQLPGIPRTKYISFFQGRLWLLDERDNLWWSAAFPFHRVFPAIAVEPLTENDNSPCTGMLPLHENMVVYKQDSIWIASFSEIDPFGIPHFLPRRIVAGIGCVANGSIKEINGEHVFLSEGGVFAFNGVTARKVSIDRNLGVDRLKDLWGRVSPGHRAYSSAAHWKTKHCYLLSIALDGANYNNYTLVWDYHYDTFWLWTGIVPSYWLEDEDLNDLESLFFMNPYGHIYAFNTSDHDHGAAIDAYVVTSRIGQETSDTKRLRDLMVVCNNQSGDVGISIMRNGTPWQNSSITKSLNYKDINEGTLPGVLPYVFNWLMERIRRLFVRIDAKFFQVKIGVTKRGTPLTVNKIEFGLKVYKR